MVRKDGQLHNTADVNDQLWRRHVDQMRDGEDIEGENASSDDRL